jgi:hypothetical protein
VGRERPDTAAPDHPRADTRAPRRATGFAPGVEDDPSVDQEELAAHVDELRRQLVSTPAEIVVANHAYGLFELAAIHLSENPPRIDDARLAIDAMANLVEGLAGRLGEPERSLKEALSQIRLAFVQIGGAAEQAEGST